MHEMLCLWCAWVLCVRTWNGEGRLSFLREAWYAKCVALLLESETRDGVHGYITAVCADLQCPCTCTCVANFPEGMRAGAVRWMRELGGCCGWGGGRTYDRPRCVIDFTWLIVVAGTPPGMLQWCGTATTAMVGPSSTACWLA